MVQGGKEEYRGLLESPGRNSSKPSVSVTVTSLSSTPNYTTAGFPGGGIVIVTLPPPPEIMVFVVMMQKSEDSISCWFDGWLGVLSPCALGSTLLVFPKVGI